MINWTGDCNGGLVQGSAELRLSYANSDGNPDFRSESGELWSGKKEGQWTLRRSDGGVQQGADADGRTTGHWTVRLRSVTVMEGRSGGGVGARKRAAGLSVPPMAL